MLEIASRRAASLSAKADTRHDTEVAQGSIASFWPSAGYFWSSWAALIPLLEKDKAVPLEFTRFPVHLLGKHSVLSRRWRQKMIRSVFARDPRRMLRNVGLALFRFLLGNDGACMRYHPEAHYMRGPGPKWRQKHALDRSMGS
jgi:hypothetical protein